MATLRLCWLVLTAMLVPALSGAPSAAAEANFTLTAGGVQLVTGLRIMTPDGRIEAPETAYCDLRNPESLAISVKNFGPPPTHGEFILVSFDGARDFRVAVIPVLYRGQSHEATVVRPGVCTAGGSCVMTIAIKDETFSDVASQRVNCP